MELTPATLTAFIGGQVETTWPPRPANGQTEVLGTQASPLIERGQIESTVIVSVQGDPHLHIYLDWMARAEGYPPRRWVMTPVTFHGIVLPAFDIRQTSNGRLAFASVTTEGTSIILFPAGDSELLDRATVEDT